MIHRAIEWGDIQENEELVLEQHHEEEKMREQRAREKCEQLGKQCWLHVLGAVWSRLKLDDAYGTPNSSQPKRHHQESCEPEQGIGLDVEIEEF